VAEPPPSAAPTASEPAPQQEPPRQRAQSSGILAFRESFSTLAENRPSARLGSGARINSSGDTAIGRSERSMVTTQAPGSSGGINLSSLSRDVGGGGGGGPQMAGVQATRVASSIGPASGGRSVGAGQGAGAGVAGRTDEEIQIVFDRYKASLYRLYNRELRKDPTLRGQMVLRLTIEPNGSVSMCELQSSDMNAPDLVQQVLERVRTFDFGAKDVGAITIVYPIDFLPAA
jgi:TonB family protein